MGTPGQSDCKRKENKLNPIPRELAEKKLTKPQCQEPGLPNRLVLFLRKAHYPLAHSSRFPPRRSSTPAKVTEKVVFNLEILIGKVDIKRILVTKHWKDEIINHILESDGELTNKKEECVERMTPMAHQVSKDLGVLKTFKIPRNCY